jgi:hypothetical protein
VCGYYNLLLSPNLTTVEELFYGRDEAILTPLYASKSNPRISNLYLVTWSCSMFTVSLDSLSLSKDNN